MARSSVAAKCDLNQPKGPTMLQPDFEIWSVYADRSLSVGVSLCDDLLETAYSGHLLRLWTAQEAFRKFTAPEDGNLGQKGELAGKTVIITNGCRLEESLALFLFFQIYSLMMNH